MKIITPIVFAVALLTSQVLGLARTTLDLGHPVSATPYDPYMSPVRLILRHMNNEENSMDRVRHLMDEGRAFRYSFTSPYVAATPAVTATMQAGDCKAKALWLADQMNDESVRFVIGKLCRTSQMWHAWLMWQHDNCWWILDCMYKSDPIAADNVSSSQYIPYYSFAKNREYRHRATQVLLADTLNMEAR